MTTEEKLQVFWDNNQLGQSGNVEEKWNLFRVGFFQFYFPNLSVDGYLLHDINHLLGGYGLDWLSEFEVAAWEVGSGGRTGFGLSNFYPLIGLLLGLIITPKRTILAYKKGRLRVNAHKLSAQGDILKIEYEDLLELSWK